jgi:hypothetical protein
VEKRKELVSKEKIVRYIFVFYSNGEDRTIIYVGYRTSLEKTACSG